MGDVQVGLNKERNERGSPANAIQSIETQQRPSLPSPRNSNQSSHRPTTHAAAGLHHLNPRSCVTCRKRKVRCDKRNPCSNCTKAHIECIFPAPGRAPRKPRKPPDSELLARLRKLEGVVQSLGGSTDDLPHSPGTLSGTSLGRQQPLPSWEGTETTRDDVKSVTSTDQVRHNAIPDSTTDHHRASLDSNFGRLVINEGKSRYINNSFWANLSNEVEDLKQILHSSSSDTEDEDFSPHSSQPGSPVYQHQGFMFGPSKRSKDLHKMHPPPTLFEKYWEIFEEHVNPLIKMNHIPTMSKQIHALKNDPSACSRGMEALLFAIYFSAITSLSPDECQALTGEERPILVSRYRHAVEEALARAHFLVTEEIIVLQALIMFLLSLRMHEGPRHIWSLTGLLVRIAVTMGLHRDGTHFNLPPFEVEMRRRIWWQVCILDVRLSEDHGCDPSILEHTFDTRLPLNIDDEDITPEMTEPPSERIGVTEMTFCLIRFEVTNTFRRLNYNPPGSGGMLSENLDVTIQDKERWIEECHQRLEETYLQYCDMNNPMHWVICTVARLVMAKSWLQIYQPYQRLDAGASLPQSTRDRLFITSLESVEYHILLAAESRTVKWSWLFKGYSQWHALAFLFSELCHRTKGPTIMRAWRAIDCMIASWGSRSEPKHQMWRPLQKILQKARAARAREVALDNTKWDDQRAKNSKEQASDARDFGLSPLTPSRSVTMTDDTTNSGSSSEVTARPDMTTTLPHVALIDQNPTVRDGLDAPTSIHRTISNNKPYASSPFFANQPMISPNQWSSDWNANTYANSNLVNEFLMDEAAYAQCNFGSYQPNPSNQKTCMTPAQQPPFNLDSTLTDTSRAYPKTNLNTNAPPFPGLIYFGDGNDGGKGNAPVPYPSNDTTNPILVGNRNSTSADGQNGENVPWQEWDEMVKEFEHEAGGLQGGRRPMQGVPWF